MTIKLFYWNNTTYKENRQYGIKYISLQAIQSLLTKMIRFAQNTFRVNDQKIQPRDNDRVFNDMTKIVNCSDNF